MHRAQAGQVLPVNLFWNSNGGYRLGPVKCSGMLSRKVYGKIIRTVRFSVSNQTANFSPFAFVTRRHIH